MTTRDRLALMAVVVLAVLAGGWLMVVSPERKQAAQAQTQVQSARQQLESAQSEAASARAAEQRYSAAYSSVVSLGKAVPPSDEVPSLIYELDHASNQRDVQFNSIVSTSSGSAATGASSSSSSSSASGTPTGFTQMPFTFVFKGSFEGLAHLLGQIDGFVKRTAAGEVLVSGRLLTIQGANITIESTSGSSASSSSGGGSGAGSSNGGGSSTGGSGAGSSGSSSGSGSEPSLNATITATAYVLPASQGLTGGATSSLPGSSTSVSSSSSSSSSSSATTPAVVKVTP